MFSTYRSFNSTNHFQEKTPIHQAVIQTYDQATGDVLDRWGEDLFYLPHGITIDSQGNVWLTDVGSHQVLKVGITKKSFKVLFDNLTSFLFYILYIRLVDFIYKLNFQNLNNNFCIIFL